MRINVTSVLVLEPDQHPAAKEFKAALVDGVRAPPRARGTLHPGARLSGTGDNGGAGRHLRQPDSDRPPDRPCGELISGSILFGSRHDCRDLSPRHGFELADNCTALPVKRDR